MPSSSRLPRAHRRAARLLAAQVAVSAALALWLAAPARAQVPPQTGATGCYPNARIELYPRPNGVGDPIGRAVDAQWLVGCAVCECGAANEFSVRVTIPTTTPPPNGNSGQLFSLVIGPDLCFNGMTDPNTRAENCAVIGDGPQPWTYWIGDGGSHVANFNPSRLVLPGMPNTCDPRVPGVGQSGQVYISLVPDFGSATPGQPYLRWQTCDATSSGNGTGTSGTGTLTALPVRLYAPVAPTGVRAEPGKNALNVTWSVNLADTDVYTYQVLCRPVDSTEPAFDRPPGASDCETDEDCTEPTQYCHTGLGACVGFRTGPGLCGDEANVACSGFSSGAVPAPMTADTLDGGTDDGTLGTLGTRGTAPDLGADGAGNGGAADVPADATSDVPGDMTGDAPSDMTADGTGAVLDDLLDPRYICAPPVISPANSARIEGLENGREYIVAVVAVNRFGNASAPTSRDVMAPRNSIDFYQKYRNDGGQSRGGYCFVATAAWGSYDHPMVRVLRAFRDRVLLGSNAGRALVRGYYRASPPLADLVAATPARRALARAALWPAVGVAYLWLELGGPALLVLLVFAGSSLMLRRRPLPPRSSPC